MEDREYLLHVQRAIREIQEHTSGFSREAYNHDTKTQRAVERNLQIVWDILLEDIPRLRAAVEALLSPSE